MEERGHVSPGFEPLADVFREEMDRRRSLLSESGLGIAYGGGALSLVLRGVCVVDICAGDTGNAENPSFSGDTLVNSFSCSKGVTAMLLSTILDTAGGVSFDTPVSAVWPEFGAKNKGEFSIADLMSHNLGLSFFDDDEVISVEQLPGSTKSARSQAEESALRDKLSQFLARQTPKWNIEKGRHGYHHLSQGLFVDALINKLSHGRHDTRTLFQDELATEAEFHFGLPPSETKRVARLAFVRTAAEDARDVHEHELDAKSLAAIENFSVRRFQDQLLPSVIGFTTALSLSTLYSAFSRAEFLYPMTRDEALEPHTHGISISCPGDHQTFTKSGLQRVPPPKGHDPDQHVHSDYEHAFFHPGFGGSFGWGDTEEQFGLSFLPSILVEEPAEEVWAHRFEIITAVYACVRRLQAKL